VRVRWQSKSTRRAEYIAGWSARGRCEREYRDSKAATRSLLRNSGKQRLPLSWPCESLLRSISNPDYRMDPAASCEVWNSELKYTRSRKDRASSSLQPLSIKLWRSSSPAALFFKATSMLCKAALVSAAQSVRVLFSSSRRSTSSSIQVRKSTCNPNAASQTTFASRCTLRRTCFTYSTSQIRARFYTSNKMNSEVSADRIEEITATYKTLARTPFIEQGTRFNGPFLTFCPR
jgi:hypothetical protein